MHSVLDMTEKNVGEMYGRAGWTWDRRKKEAELRHADARLLVLSIPGEKPKRETEADGGAQPPLSGIDSSQEPVAYLCFRWTAEINDGGRQPLHRGFKQPTMYVWELHVASNYARQGLGSFLMRACIQIAKSLRIHQLMLTVFHCNPTASVFYRSKFHFQPHFTSPSKEDDPTATYDILFLEVASTSP